MAVVNECQRGSSGGCDLDLVHRSLLVSISPKSSLLPPLREVAAEVADAAEWTEKAVDGLLARTYPAGRSRMCVILKD